MKDNTQVTLEQIKFVHIHKIVSTQHTESWHALQTIAYLKNRHLVNVREAKQDRSCSPKLRSILCETYPNKRARRLQNSVEHLSSVCSTSLNPLWTQLYKQIRSWQKLLRSLKSFEMRKKGSFLSMLQHLPS